MGFCGEVFKLESTVVGGAGGYFNIIKIYFYFIKIITNKAKIL